MKLYNFSVRLYNEVGEIETKEFKNVFEFSFPADGKFFYTAQKPEVSDEMPGSASIKTNWLPLNRVVEINGLQTTKFNTLKERKAFKDSLNF